MAVWSPLVPSTTKLKGFVVDAERSETVSVLLCPRVMEEGLNEQVGPDSQEREMLPEKVLGPEAEMVNVVDVVPIRMTFEGLDTASENPDVPVPVRETVCEPPETLLVMVIVPVRDPVAVGVKVTKILQVAPTAREAGQVFV